MMKYDEDVMHRLKRMEGLPLKYPDDRVLFLFTSKYNQ
ncbi:hypothetical protein J2S08_004451 [Bacillus chungangensis]|uniref:Uncharacterized protein n=1 Tax=Bacillus chungangensis TaxID=587633 RepID=A0ABT9WZ83_9BACI|nr:hypothetical protein [Bacillus chungangensis]